MVNLTLQRRLASSILKVGSKRVWMDPNEVNEIALANSRKAVRKLIKDNFIFKKTYRRNQKQKNILDLELGSCVDPQGHQPACTRFCSQETVFGKIRSSTLPAFGTRSDWLLLSSSHHFRRKLSFSTGSPIEEPE